MCMGPMIQPAQAPSPPTRAATQITQGVAEASPEVWSTLAQRGGMMGQVARRKLSELQTPPAIPKGLNK